MINLTKLMVQIESCSSDFCLTLGIFRKSPIYRLESNIWVTKELWGSIYMLNKNSTVSTIAFLKTMISFFSKPVSNHLNEVWFYF